ACSHWLRSTTAPALTPRDWIWLWPISSTAWVRPRSASLGGHGLSRAIRQAILLVPISRAATNAERLGGMGRVFGVWARSKPLMRRRPSSWTSYYYRAFFRVLSPQRPTTAPSPGPAGAG